MKPNFYQSLYFKSLFILGLVLLIILPFSCENDTQDMSNLSLDQIKKLQCHGFDPANVQYIDGRYLIDNCYLIEESHLNFDFDENFNQLLDINKTEIGLDEILPRQYATHSENSKKVSMTNVQLIKYYIDPALKNILYQSRYWVNNIQTAKQIYNDIPGCRINFVETQNASQANLTFFSTTHPPQNLSNWYHPQNLVGLACWPNTGNIGRYISLRPVATNYSTDTRVGYILHEIGHTLGMRHTCVDPAESPNPTPPDNCGNSVGKYAINGIPEIDCGSIMKPAVPNVVNNNVLNVYDLLSFRFMYPDSYNTPTLSSLTKYSSSGLWYAKVKTSTLPSPQVPYRIVIARYSLAGSLMQSYIFYRPNNNLKEFNVQTPTGTWKFKVWYLNHGDYGVGSNTMQITI